MNVPVLNVNLSLFSGLKRRTMVQAKAWILRHQFVGFPKASDFEMKLEELPEPKDGGKGELLIF